MSRWADLLKIRPGEGRMASLVIGLMVLTSAGFSLGSTGVEALFFARFGVQYLPFLYMGLAVLTGLTSLAITAMLGRLPRTRLYLALPVAMAVVLVAARALLLLDLPGAYPGLWLGKEVLNALMGLFCWGVAGAVCDTRQAKRLFPLFGAGRILGAVLGGFGTGPLVAVLGTENLLLLWAGALLAAFGLTRALLGAPAVALAAPRRQPRPASLAVEMQRGFQFVRRSPLMGWIAVAAVLFSILYFSIALPFAKTMAAQFPDEAELAGFLGLFNGLSTAAAFLASLILANRLYARFGLMVMLLAFPILYLAGFAWLALAASFPAIVAFRFAQMVWLAGLADAAYQALFNAVPAERRDQVRAFISGGPEQAGTLIAGVVLWVGEQAFAPAQLYLVGLAAAAVTAFSLWRASRAYRGALLEALRAGQPSLFFSEEEPFGGFRRDAAAVAVAQRGLTDANAAVRRVSAEILGHLQKRGHPAAAQVTAALVAALDDPVGEVRRAVLCALSRANAASALLAVAARLRDPEPEVRLQAVETLRSLAGYPQGLADLLQPLLADPEAAVRARAAVALLALGPHAQARDQLRQMAVLGQLDERVHALNALADWGDAEAYALIEAELADAYAPAAVRRAAARALAAGGAAAIPPLAQALGDRDNGVREAAVDALIHLGAPALPPVVAALNDPTREAAALLTLQGLPAWRAADALRQYVDRRLTATVHYDLLWRDVAPQARDERIRLLADSLRDSARQQALNALRALGLLEEREAVRLAAENLQSRTPAQVANALEALETLPTLSRLRPLLRPWEPADAQRAVVPLDQHLADLLEAEPEAWIRAGAALAAAGSSDPDVRAALARRAVSDPDELVRSTALSALGTTMNTLPTLSVMDRILFLRRVPLFVDLAPADLKQVAVLASEQVFPDGETLVAQGEAGDELYVLVSGEVRVSVDGAEVARRKSGDVVGEMAIISQEPRMASLIAAGDVRALSLDRKSFEGLLRERPDVSLAVMRVLCARLAEATR